MDKRNSPEMNPAGLRPFLSPLAVWALSVGTAIGWGSLVVTSTDYLSQAGPAGTVIGLLMGLVMMLMVANHYSFLGSRYPEAGGLYAYTKHVFGYDQAYLVSWVMFLVYISIFWANATSLPVFARYFLRGAFCFGRLYSIFGYEVYLGEVLLTLAAIGAITLFCINSRKFAANTMIVLVLFFTIGITICFAAALLGANGAKVSMDPAFVPDKSVFRQIIRIAFISPWAFIGFESVSHSAEEFNFKISKLHRILVISLIVTTLLYIFVTLLSISAYPAGCSGWFDYISRLDEFQGIEGLPAFYAAASCLGKPGLYILMASLIALIFTSLIGNMMAISRLFYSISQDGILPKSISHLNNKNVPVNAMIFVALVSAPIPFIGRTAMGWIVDVTIIGAAIIYGFVSMAVLKVAKTEKIRKQTVLGYICLVILIAYMVFLMMPNIFGDYTIGTETYLLLTLWPVAGFFYFQGVIRKDQARRFGKAIIVWLSLLAFIVLMATAWLGRAKQSVNQSVLMETREHYSTVTELQTSDSEDEEFMETQLRRLSSAEAKSTIFIFALFALSLGALFANNASSRKWEEQAEQERDAARTVAYRDQLTGVKSKHAFAEKEAEIEETIRSGSAGEFGIVVCDVNGLKVINDTLGHKAGDEYIRSSCRMLCEYFKHSPVFRIGGDEFTVILSGQDYENRHAIMRSINEKIESNIGTGNVVISLGQTEYDPKTDRSFHDIFERADSLMYERKKQLKAWAPLQGRHKNLGAADW